MLCRQRTAQHATLKEHTAGLTDVHLLGHSRVLPVGMSSAIVVSGCAGDNSEPARPPPNAETEFQTTWEGVDEEQPATSVQLRLVDGSRMVSPFLGAFRVLGST